MGVERKSSSAKRADGPVLVTLIHAGYDEKDIIVRLLLKRILSGRLNATYNASLQAVALQRKPFATTPLLKAR